MNWPVQRLRLEPARWVRLPGTQLEVMLHGKASMDSQAGIDIGRTGDGRPQWGGWDLTPVADCCYVRRAS